MARQSFFTFCYRPDYAQQIEDLVALARPERWDYQKDSQDVPHQILVNYINHTFMRPCELNTLFPETGYIYETEEYKRWRLDL